MYSQHHIKASANDTNLGNFLKAGTTFQFFGSLFLALNPDYSEKGAQWLETVESGAG